MHLNKLNVGKPDKTFASIFEWVFEAAGFSAGGVFCTEQPIPEVKLHLKKIIGTAATLMRKNVSINNKKNVLTLMEKLLGAFNLDW